MTSPEVIVFPDVEQLYCDWLPAALTAHGVTVPVSSRVPSPRPARFVRVMRVGGPVNAVFILDQPTVVFEAWDRTESGAVAVISLVRALVASTAGQTIGGTFVLQVGEFAGPANLPDPTSGQLRYTYTASILLRGSVL